MSWRAFAAEITIFNKLFGVIPGTTGISHEYSQNKTGGGGPDQQAHHSGHAQQNPGSNGNNNGQKRGDHHGLLSSFGRNSHTTSIIRLSCSIPDPRNFPELPPDFIHHTAGCLSDSHHGQATEDKSHHCSDEHPDQNNRIHQIDPKILHEIEKSSLSCFNNGPIHHLKSSLTDTNQSNFYFFYI